MLRPRDVYREIAIMAMVAAVKDLTAGTAGGILASLIGHPLDTLKVRLQTQPMNPPVVSVH